MHVTDHEVAALRAYLLDGDDADELLAASQGENEIGLAALFAGTFAEAVRRRFSPPWSRPDVIRFVAAARSRDRWYAELIEPRHAEKLLRTMLGDGDPAGLDNTIKAQQTHLLAALVDDARLDGQGIDELITAGRRHATNAAGHLRHADQTTEASTTIPLPPQQSDY